MNLHPSDTPLALQHALADALRDLPGAVELRAFGSLTGDDHDAHSDVDLEILTADVEASVAARRAIIERVAPVWLEWRIFPSHSAWAATILFENLSPCHHLDLGITPIGAAQAIDPLDARTVLWTQMPPSALPGTTHTSPFAPEVGSPAHVMLEHLLSATRYVKARKRGQLLTAYRFASALAAATFAMLDAARTGDLDRLRQKPSTMAFLSLDAHLPESDRLALLGLLDVSRPDRMDATVLALLRYMLRLHDELPDVPTFPQEIADRLVAFVADEFDVEGEPTGE